MAKRKRKLTVALLCEEAAKFAEIESTYPEPTLYGVTNMSGGGRPMQSSWHSFPTRNGSITHPSSLILAVTEPDAPLSNNRRVPN